MSADDDNSLANPGNVDIMHRTVLTAPVTITLGKLPTVKIAFGATAAIGWGYGAAGTGGHVLLVQMQQVFLALNQV